MTEIEEKQVLCQLLIPKSLESSLAELARSERTTVNRVIFDILMAAVQNRAVRLKRDEIQR